MRGALPTVMLGLSISACTSFRPVEEPADQLQREIAGAELLSPGDQVRLVTGDGDVHEFRVAAIDATQGTLSGKRDSVQIKNIVTLEKRELSWTKTGILIGGLVLGILGTDCEDECNEYGGFMCC